MDKLITEKFENMDIRIINKESNPWFIAKDVCDVLGIVNNRDAVEKLRDEEKTIININESNSVGESDTITTRGNPHITIISESGVYKLMMRSNKPEAERFIDWVSAVVLPTIRKTGAYIDKPLTEEQIAISYLESVRAKNKLQEQNKLLEEQNKILQPKAEAFEDIIKNDRLLDFAAFSKSSAFCISNKIGRNDLFKLLRDKNILLKTNLPYQHFIDQGYFEVKQVTAGEKTYSKTYITKKGITWVEKQIK